MLYLYIVAVFQSIIRADTEKKFEDTIGEHFSFDEEKMRIFAPAKTETI